MDWLAGILGLILDMDGVLWRGDEPLLDIPGFFNEAESMGLKVTLATNNATKSVPQYLERFAHFGATLHPDQIVNSPMAAAYYLRARFPNGGPIYIVGESGLHDTLAGLGFTHAEEGVLAVVAGLDRHATYAKLSKASQLVRSGVQFVGTNPDKTFPAPHGLIPGSGSILAFIEAATDVQPLIMGKPEPFMFNLAITRMGFNACETLAIGDRLDTDILGGQKAGCRTAVVLSGVSTQQDVADWSPTPDLVLDNLSDLLPRIQHARQEAARP